MKKLIIIFSVLLLMYVGVSYAENLKDKIPEAKTKLEQFSAKPELF